MSDGNFNRALLPHTPYASGMKAGKQIAKMKATELYRLEMKRLHPEHSEDELTRLAQEFEHRLSCML